MASFKASARSLDQGVGTVLNALEEHGLVDNTLVIMTTDHGLAFPDAKCTMFDRGIGVLLLMRGPGGFSGGRVHDALVSQLDLYPTICDIAGIEPPDVARGDIAAPARPRRGRRGPRRDLRRGHLPRRVRAPACGAHRAGTSTCAASTTSTPAGSSPTSTTG